MGIGNIHDQQMCIPCFNWEARQGARGKQAIFTADNASHYVSRDTPAILRTKFGLLSLLALVGITALRLPSRCIFLVTGSWAFVGCEKANKIWMQQCVRCARENLPPPHLLTYYRIVTISILSELIQDIIKCVTLPLASIGMLCAIMWGMFNPYDGRKLIGGIEDLWSIELPSWAKYEIVEHYVNRLAFCMQDIEAFKKHNLFQYFRDYSPHTLRSLLLSLETLHKEGLSHIGNFEVRIRSWTEAVKQQSSEDAHETDKYGNLRQNLQQRRIKIALLALFNASIALNQAIVIAAATGPVVDPQLQVTINIAAAQVDQICSQA